MSVTSHSKNVETVGKKIDTIDVKISYKIIDLFSGGLYSSPNKAFEELVCNSYDAFADKVAVFLPPSFDSMDSTIWVCDNGEGMNQQELKDLWLIGETNKRKDPSRDKRRLQIGRFGIGKLATYVLCRKLTFISKKDGKYLATTMDYGEIKKDKGKRDWELAEREIEEKDAIEVLNQYAYSNGNYQLPFDIFGENAAPNWTFALLTDLTPKCKEITEGRLRWVLSTALPLNPSFRLFYNNKEVLSSKISLEIDKLWIMGKDDDTANKDDTIKTNCNSESSRCTIDFPHLKEVYGQFELYKDSLMAGKSGAVGRSHGIFLMIRGRLVNLDDPLLGLSQFSIGPWYKTRVVVNADGLDFVLTSGRESIMDTEGYRELKSYLRKKFDNEVKKYYYEEEEKEYLNNNLSYRLRGSSTFSKEPLYKFALRYYEAKVINPLLLEKPQLEAKDELLKELQKELSETESVIKDTKYVVLNPGDPIAKLDLHTGILNINLVHPFVANYSVNYQTRLTLQFVAVTEVLTEAYLYELELDESLIHGIMRKRDSILRQLSLSDRQSIPAVAQLLNDSMRDPTGLEDAVYSWFVALGFEASKIGKAGEPDGRADAVLGYNAGESLNYSIVYDAKSTRRERVPSGNVHTASLIRHMTKYNADFGVVVAMDYEGSSDPESAISQETTQQGITALTIRNLHELLFLWAPHQLGLSKLKKLFETAHTPLEVSRWIEEVKNEAVRREPFKEVLESIYLLQKNDRETPDISAVRSNLIYRQIIGNNILKEDVLNWIKSLKAIVPDFISIDIESVRIEGTPDKIMEVIGAFINEVPTELQNVYYSAFLGNEH